MSATNRGSKRNKNDFYETPQYCITNFLNHHWLDNNAVIFDPGCGSGAFPKALRKSGYLNQIDAIDIDEMIYRIDEVDNKYFGNFIEFNPPYEYDVVIGNPPYCLAKEFVKKSFEIVNKNKFEIIMLLRINFLGSQDRHDFWQKFPVNDIYVLSKRPSFAENGKDTDATEYAFFVWNGSDEQHIYVI